MYRSTLIGVLTQVQRLRLDSSIAVNNFDDQDPEEVRREVKVQFEIIPSSATEGI